MLTGSQFAQQARQGNYIGIAYSKLDCQAFVERVLKDCGISYNWRGSNHIWREALSEKHEITDVNEIPAGAWIFTVKSDGGEKARGYNDNEKNAKHVGIYLGFGDVIHSTSPNGVQYDSIYSQRWTHWGKCKYIDYSESENPEKQENLIDILGMLEQKTLKEIIEAARKRGWI